MQGKNRESKRQKRPGGGNRQAFPAVGYWGLLGAIIVSAHLYIFPVIAQDEPLDDGG
jgi:hypothetical protein